MDFLRETGMFDFLFFDEFFFACLGGLLLARFVAHQFVKQYAGIHHVVKVFWFMGAVYYQIDVLRNQDWLPFYMGGNHTLNDTTIWDKPEPVLDNIYKMGFAFHLHNAILDAILGTKLAFYIHHIVTLVLIVSSQVNDYQRVGCCVFIVHDIPDVFTALTKATVPLKTPIFAIISVICLLSSWAVCRLYLLTWIAVDVYTTMPDPNMPVFCGMLVILECLHIYWFFLIIKMVLKFGKSGDIKDESEKEGRLENTKSKKKD